MCHIFIIKTCKFEFIPLLLLLLFVMLVCIYYTFTINEYRLTVGDDDISINCWYQTPGVGAFIAMQMHPTAAILAECGRHYM